MIKIYTDGSCLKNPGDGGWAAIIIRDDESKSIEERIKANTKENNYYMSKKSCHILINKLNWVKTSWTDRSA